MVFRGSGAGGMTCPICAALMRPDVLQDTYRCPSCDFFASTLPVQINQTSRIDEAARECGLAQVRSVAFAKILDTCARHLAAGASMLEVGCGHGWFVRAASARGYAVTAIEPDKDVKQAPGVAVLRGFFPNVLPETARYDAIVFNDVFEHLPDIDGMAGHVDARLNPGGIAVVNLPVSTGLIFRLARIVARLGYKAPLARMWQQGLPSPHLSYFSAAALGRLMPRHGLALVERQPLEAIGREGLYQRIRYDQAMPAPMAVGLYVAALAVHSVARWFPADIEYFVFRKGGG